MKVLLALLATVGMWMTASVAHAQMGTACIGCMPRTGPVFDSTMTTPAPSFSTTAGTGDVYIPPREVIVTVPGPVVVTPPAANPMDPSSFSSTKFTCSAGGVGNAGAQGAALTLYQNIGGRCADTEGLAFWATTLVNCVAANPDYGWSAANSAGPEFYMLQLSPCGITSGVTSNINTPADQASMNQICANDAATRGFVTNAYSYIRGQYSATCGK
jgi:hypothetical protein